VGPGNILLDWEDREGVSRIETERECQKCVRGFQPCWVCEHVEAAVMASAGQG
jgi:hypothetical protein